MEEKKITVRVVMDAKTFRSFALFDSLLRRRLWRAPALFAGILLFFALLCFLLRERAEQAALLGVVLLAVGLGLPAVYFFTFLRSVRMQIRKLKLDRPRPVYTVTISAAEGVRAAVKKESACYRWEDLHSAYRRNGCIYLYVSAQRAYLLPEPQITGGVEDLWRLLGEKMPSGCLFDERRPSA